MNDQIGNVFSLLPYVSLSSLESMPAVFEMCSKTHTKL